MTLALKHIPGTYAICRFAAGTPMPHWFHPGGFSSASWSDNELSIVCDESQVPDDVQCDRGWQCLMLQGPFAFDETGILLQVLQPLAAASIGIFAVSTFDTDYVLVKEHHFEAAMHALTESGLILHD
ncbi:MAG: ACT domain-containing protein [Pseudoxanthomonas sp.]